MPGRLFEGELTVPAGTQPAAPVTLTLAAIPEGIVTSARLTVPPGHAGFTGFQLAIAGTPVVPYLGGWIVADDDKFDVPLDQEVAPGQVVMQGYNTDIYQHTFYLRVFWKDGPAVQPVTPDLAIAAPQPAALGAVEQLAQPAPEPTAAAPEVIAAPDAPCFDAAGNQVDCASPDAVTGPALTPAGG